MFESCGGCCMSVVLIPLLCCALVVGGVIYVYSTAPEPPLQANFQPSLAQAQSFEQQVTRAYQDAINRRNFDLTFYEQDFSSWLALRGEDFARAHGRDFPFSDIQVGMDEGVMTFFANVDLRGLDLPLEVIVDPGVDSDGQIDLDIKEAHMGGIIVPNFVLDDVKRELEDALTQSFDALGGRYRLFPETVTVQNGQFSVQGMAN